MKRAAIIALVVLLAPASTRAQDTIDRSRDRGEGLPLSMFGTYLKKGELIVYPFFEYYRDNNFRTKPS